ncbi:hypothetical protein WJ978_25195 [Achromobacter xylosoxidans]
MYAWEKRTGWTSVDFDRAQAYVGNYHVVTTTGAGAAYPLRAVEIAPDSRRILKGVALTAPFDRPEAAAQLWEFIRLYMDAEPAALPPVALVPDHRVNAYAWMDRELFPYAIDRHHRLVRPFAFWFFSGAYYLPNWMECWIRRFDAAPRCRRNWRRWRAGKATTRIESSRRRRKNCWRVPGICRP